MMMTTLEVTAVCSCSVRQLNVGYTTTDKSLCKVNEAVHIQVLAAERTSAGHNTMRQSYVTLHGNPNLRTYKCSDQLFHPVVCYITRESNLRTYKCMINCFIQSSVTLHEGILSPDVHVYWSIVPSGRLSHYMRELHCQTYKCTIQLFYPVVCHITRGNPICRRTIVLVNWTIMQVKLFLLYDYVNSESL